MNEQVPVCGECYADLSREEHGRNCEFSDEHPLDPDCCPECGDALNVYGVCPACDD